MTSTIDTFHILNGDALAERFPEALRGQKIIFRECLIEGPLNYHSLGAFTAARKDYLAQKYPEVDPDFYDQNVKPLFSQIIAIPPNSSIYLWFEDDLFCQTNMWFALYLLHEHTNNCQYLWVRPENALRYGFGGLSNDELIELAKNPVKLNELRTFSNLWKAYAANDNETLQAMANALKTVYPAVANAIQAQQDWVHSQRPERMLVQIKEELQTNDFATIFKTFGEREPIYGFGDLQVKSILRQWTTNN